MTNQTIVVQTALNWFALQYFGSDDKQAHRNSTDFILKIALAHPKIVLGWINRHCRYRDAEGFADDEALLAARIMECKEYKLDKKKAPPVKAPTDTLASAQTIVAEIFQLPKHEQPIALDMIRMAARLTAQRLGVK